MTTDTKKLAEFAAEFLGWKLIVSGDDKRMYRFKESLLDSLPTPCTAVEDLIAVYEEKLEGLVFSPIGAHIAKREMEKRGWKWDEWYLPEHKIFGFRIEHPKDVHLMKYYFSENANSYIAFWTAIQEAVGEK